MSWTNNASFIQRVEQWKEAWIWSQTNLGLNPGFTTYKLQDPGRGTSSLWTSVPLLEKKLGSKDPGQVRELNEKMHTEYLTWDRCSINSRHYYSFWISLRRCERWSSSVTQRVIKAPVWAHQCQSRVSTWAQNSEEPSSILPCLSVCKIFASNLPRLAPSP